MPSSIQIVRQFFPSVKRVQDAARSIEIEVTKADTTSSKVKKHQGCAMAVACKRKFQLDGVVISRSIAYLVKDRVATRYNVPQAVVREVVSFDRGAGFAPGTYALAGINASHRLGARAERASVDRNKPGNGTPRKRPHQTINVRAALGALGHRG